MNPKRRLVKVEPGSVSLLEHIFTGSPNLPGALCQGAYSLIDAALFPEPHADTSTARAHLTALCRRCPVNRYCVDTLNTH